MHLLPSGTGQFGCAPILVRTILEHLHSLHPFGTGQFWSIHIPGSPAHAPLALAEGATSVASPVCRPPAFMNGRRRRGLPSAPCSLLSIPSSRGHPVHSTEDNRHPGAPPIFLMLHTACPHIRTNQTVNQPYTRIFLHALCPAV